MTIEEFLLDAISTIVGFSQGNTFLIFAIVFIIGLLGYCAFINSRGNILNGATSSLRKIAVIEIIILLAILCVSYGFLFLNLFFAKSPIEFKQGNQLLPTLFLVFSFFTAIILFVQNKTNRNERKKLWKQEILFYCKTLIALALSAFLISMILLIAGSIQNNEYITVISFALYASLFYFMIACISLWLLGELTIGNIIKKEFWAKFKKETSKSLKAKRTVIAITLLVAVITATIWVGRPNIHKEEKITFAEITASLNLEINQTIESNNIYIKTNHEDDVNIEFSIIPNVFYYYLPNNKNENLNHVISLNNYNKEKVGCGTDLVKLLNGVNMQKLEPDYFTYNNSKEICFVSANYFSSINLKDEYYREYPYPEESERKEIEYKLPNLEYSYNKTNCESTINFEKKSEVETRITLFISLPKEIRFQKCYIKDYEHLGNCYLENANDETTPLKLLIRIDDDTPKKGQVIVDYNC